MPLDLLSTPHHERQFSDLIDRAFGLKNGVHFLSDFPIWDAALSPRGTTKLGVWENDELVACAGVRIAQLKTDTRKLCPVALIGAVATAESHRGKGYASQVVNLAGEWATAKGAALSILWGSEHALYERIGYELCGTQVRAPIPTADSNPNSQFTFHSGWSDRIFDQMKKRRLGLLLDESDRKWMAAHQGTHWFRVEREGALVAYAALGRGIDLPNLVHEWWAIDRNERQALFHGILQAHPQAELLGQPELLSIEGIPFFPDAVEFMALMKILDPGKVVETFAYPRYRPLKEGARGFLVLARAHSKYGSGGWMRFKKEILVLVVLLATFSIPAEARRKSIAKQIEHAAKQQLDLALVKVPEDDETCFSPDEPCDIKLLKFIDSAKVTLDIAIFDINLDLLVKHILEQSRKIPVRIVVDKRQAKGDHSAVPRLLAGGAQVRYGSQRGIMHNKFVIVDGKMVEIGSFNYTNHAAEANEENQIYIGKSSVVDRYKKRFEKIWEKGKRIAP